MPIRGRWMFVLFLTLVACLSFPTTGGTAGKQVQQFEFPMHKAASLADALEAVEGMEKALKNNGCLQSGRVILTPENKSAPILFAVFCKQWKDGLGPRPHSP